VHTLTAWLGNPHLLFKGLLYAHKPRHDVCIVQSNILIIRLHLMVFLQIETLIAPLEAAAAAEVARLEGMERQRAALAAQVADLTRRAANLE
jgi:hypothetical protein